MSAAQAASVFARTALRSRTQVVRRGDFQGPGESLPFTTDSKAKVALYMFGLTGAVFATPFVLGHLSSKARGFPGLWSGTSN
eukprot:m.250942 g.250942  ORF g.250942 m.250942 type:complete len:82 (+) comp19102_c3_seq1:2614-2859(+)